MWDYPAGMLQVLGPKWVWARWVCDFLQLKDHLAVPVTTIRTAISQSQHHALQSCRQRSTSAIKYNAGLYL